MAGEEKKADPFDLASGVPGIEGELRPKPKYADRISKRVLGVIGVIFGLLVLVFLFALDNMDKKKPAEPEKQETKRKADDKEGKAGLDELKGEGSTPNLVPPAPTQPPPPENPSPIPIEPNSPIPKEASATTPTVPALTPAQEAAIKAQQDRLARRQAARIGGLSSLPYSGDEVKTANATVDPLAAAAALMKNANGVPAAGPVAQSQAAPDGEQEQKLDFLKKASTEDHGYHPYMPLPAMSPHEVKKGSYIPMSLEQAINSDLPGHITARVTEPVYDTVTGCELLIPPLVKVEGEYDSKVALGQNRILVAWNSMIFPDGSELNLAGMQGYDAYGQAGLQSDVDNHYLRLFGSVFGMSMVTAGIQMSVPPSSTSSTNGGTTAAQAISSALTQQYGQLGAQMMGKYLAVQPTLRNYAGERFTIMVPRTIIFNKVWANRCMR